MAEGVIDSNLETPKAQIVNGWVGVQMEQGSPQNQSSF
jgi:hypothetical protein